MQAIILKLRERREGTIIHVTSSATLSPRPLVAAYTASKTAIEGFTCSLGRQLKDFGIGMKLVERGYGLATSSTAGLAPASPRMGSSEWRD